jgi:YD repeat-containing protein
MTRSGVVTSYGYDGWGNLIQETTNGVTTEFVLDENTAYTRILGEVRSDGGERLYAYGPEDSVRSRRSAAGSSIRCWMGWAACAISPTPAGSGM